MSSFVRDCEFNRINCSDNDNESENEGIKDYIYKDKEMEEPNKLQSLGITSL